MFLGLVESAVAGGESADWGTQVSQRNVSIIAEVSFG